MRKKDFIRPILETVEGK